MTNKAVILLSGGLDSATTLAIAKDQGHQCYALSIDYGQRHRVELNAAREIAQRLEVVEHRIVTIDLTQFGGSALTDHRIAVPESAAPGIPVTYVPARNTIMLSLALAWAEVLVAQHIFIGVNAVDYSGYPDCRPNYIHAFETLANLATKRAVEGSLMRIHSPLIALSKSEIIKTGMRMNVDYAMTISCYQPDGAGFACGRCDACRLRRDGFREAGVPDPTRYLFP